MSARASHRSARRANGNPSGRLIVVDHSLLDMSGHHFEYDCAVAAAAENVGRSALVLANAAYSESTSPFPVRPTFAQGAYTSHEAPGLRALIYPLIAALPGPLGRSLHRVAGDFWARWRRQRASRPAEDFGSAITQVLDGIGATSDDDLLIHTLSSDDLESLVASLVARLPKPIRFHILLRRTPAEMDRARPAGHRVEDMLATIWSSGLYPDRVRFLTDTERLREAYEALSPVRFAVAPIVFRQDLLLTALAAPRRPSPLTIVYLGTARREKGFHLLPDLVGQTLKAHSPGSVRFLIQATLNIPSGEPGIPAAIQRLSQFPPDQVILIRDALDSERFYETLAASDILLLPYDADAYTLRSSGLQAQAMAAGIPVLVPAATWMEEQLAAGGGVSFESTTALSTTLDRLIDSYPLYRQRARAAAADWRARHDPGGMIAVLSADAPRAVAP